MADENNLTTLAKRLRPLMKLAAIDVITEYPADHGSLSGLGDDDHTQYVHNTAGRTISAQHSFSPSIAQAPFLLSANAQGQTVTGLKADQLNKSISSSGLGLSGGGALTADQTITLASSSNPGAAASILATDADGYLNLVRLKTDTLADRSGGNLVISPAGDITLDPTGNDILPLTNYDLNLGMINKKFLALHAAELWVETLVAQDTLATIGGRVLVAPTTTLTRDMSNDPAVYLMYVKHNQMKTGDRVYMEAGGKVEWFAINDDGGLQGEGDYAYWISRDLDGSGPNYWYAGDAVLNTGQAGDGYIDLYSLRSVRSASHIGPTIAGNVRNSGTYSDLSEVWAIGNLNGLYGYGADTYGAAFGKYINSQSFLTIDATNGIRMRYRDGSGNLTTRAQWDTSGNLLIGQTGASQSNIYLTAGKVQFRINTTVKSYIDVDGGFVVNDPGGGVYDRTAAITWNDGTNDIATLGSYSSGVLIGCELKSLAVSGKTSSTYIKAETPAGGSAPGIYLIAGHSDATERSIIQIVGSTSANIWLTTKDVKLGNTTDACDLTFTGKFISWRKDGLTYDAWPFHPIEGAPLSSAIFDGSTTYSDVSGSTEWDLNTDMGVPHYAKAVLLEVQAKDSVASLTDGLYFACGPTATYWYHTACRPPGVVTAENVNLVPCSLDVDNHPTLFYRIEASGINTMVPRVRCIGYCI